MKNVYVGRWDLLPEKWDGIRGLTEMFPDAIIREVGRQMKVVGNKDPLLGTYTLQEFEETFNYDAKGLLTTDTYWIKIF